MALSCLRLVNCSNMFVKAGLPSWLCSEGRQHKVLMETLLQLPWAYVTAAYATD